MHFLTWLEQTDLSRWVTESPSLFAYPSILFLHTAGLAFLVGPSIAISARILGFPAGLPIWPMEKFYPVMWWGFWINFVSGVVLLIADATTKLTNWDFYVKLAFIGIAVIALRMIRKRVFGNPSIKDERRASQREDTGGRITRVLDRGYHRRPPHGVSGASRGRTWTQEQVLNTSGNRQRHL